VKKKVPYRIVFQKPNKADIEDAEFFYSQKFNEFINMGFLTRAMLNKKMGDNGGVASKVFTEDLQRLIKENMDASRIIEFYGAAKDLDKEQKNKLEEAKAVVAITQKQIMDYETAINQQYNHTADIKAEHKLYEFFIFNFSFFEESIKGEKKLFPIFEGETYNEKRDFYLEIAEDVDDIEDEDFIKNKEIFDASFDKLIKVINIWYRGLGKNQEEIDDVIKALEESEKQVENDTKEEIQEEIQEETKEEVEKVDEESQDE